MLRTMDLTRPARAARSVWLVVTTVHLVSQLTGPDLLRDVSQVLLMPAVAGILLTHTREPRSRLVRLTLAALFFSWLGDTCPRFTSGDPAFLLMVAGFLVAQLLYCRAFWPYRAASSGAQHRWLLVVGGAAVVGLVALVAPQAPVLAAPVGVYGLALVAMVLLGSGVNRAVGLGAAVFLVSDATIGLRAFTDLDFPGSGFWVMATYVCGQTLITLGVAARDRQQRPAAEPARSGTA